MAWMQTRAHSAETAFPRMPPRLVSSSHACVQAVPCGHFLPHHTLLCTAHTITGSHACGSPRLVDPPVLLAPWCAPLLFSPLPPLTKYLNAQAASHNACMPQADPKTSHFAFVGPAAQRTGARAYCL